jgi:hypothetical protein
MNRNNRVVAGLLALTVVVLFAELGSPLGVGILDPAGRIDPVDRMGVGKATSTARNYFEFVFPGCPLIHKLDNDPSS